MEDLNCVLNDTKVHDVHKQQNYKSLKGRKLFEQGRKLECKARAHNSQCIWRFESKFRGLIEKNFNQNLSAKFCCKHTHPLNQNVMMHLGWYTQTLHRNTWITCEVKPTRVETFIRKMMGVGQGGNQGLLEMSPTFELYLSSSTRQT